MIANEGTPRSRCFLAKATKTDSAMVVALLAAMLGAVVALGLAASAASAETFSNDAGITINDDANPRRDREPGTATPYPSEIEVSALTPRPRYRT